MQKNPTIAKIIDIVPNWFNREKYYIYNLVFGITKLEIEIYSNTQVRIKL